jgi:hypothetical protein
MTQGLEASNEDTPCCAQYYLIIPPPICAFERVAGFSQAIARWTATNLVPVQQGNAAAGFTWLFDLDGIHQMYK